MGAAESACGRVEANDEVGGVFSFPGAKQAAYAGTTLIALGGAEHLRLASEQAARAIALYESGESRERSSGDVLAARLDLATVLLQKDELDGAGAEFGHVLAVAPERRTSSIIKRSRGLAPG